MLCGKPKHVLLTLYKQTITTTAMSKRVFHIFVFALFCFCFKDATAQKPEWFIGAWKGGALKRDKRDTRQLQTVLYITAVNGNLFEGYVRRYLTSDTAVQYNSKVSGTINEHSLTALTGETIYKKEPPGGKWDTKCNGCGVITFLYTIEENRFVLTGEIRKCADACNGISVYSRSMDEFMPEVKLKLTTLFGSEVEKDSVGVAAANTDTSKIVKNENTIEEKKPVLHSAGDTVIENRIVNTKATEVPSVDKKNNASVIINTKKEVFEKREINLFKVYEVFTDSVLLRVFDNGVVDGDTVSVFFNDDVVINRLGLTTKAFEIKLPINLLQDNKVVLYAHNLGTISPNTAMLEIYSGKQFYNVTVSSDLEKSSGVILRYKK